MLKSMVCVVYGMTHRRVTGIFFNLTSSQFCNIWDITWHDIPMQMSKFVSRFMM